MDAILKKNIHIIQENKGSTELCINNTKTKFEIDTGAEVNDTNKNIKKYKK